MANVKKGLVTAPREWWKHLRWTKRPFWKAERRAARALARSEIATDESVAQLASRKSASDGL